MNKTLKYILIGSVVFTAVYFAYYFFTSSKTQTPTGLSPVVGQATSIFINTTNPEIAQKTAFLNSLFNLNKIKIDSSLLKSNMFTHLQDNTVPIESSTSNVGRQNPFSSFDTMSPADTTTSLPQLSSSDVPVNKK